MCCHSPVRLGQCSSSFGGFHHSVDGGIVDGHNSDSDNGGDGGGDGGGGGGGGD